MTLLMTLNVLLLAIVFHFTPVIRKRSLFFGVSIDQTFRETPAAQFVVHTYRLSVWAGSAAALAAVWLLDHKAPLALLLQCLTAIGGWVWANRKVRPFAIRTDLSVPDSNERESLSAGLVVATVMIPFAGPIAAAWHLWSRYELLPARYPVHWNAAGEADRFADKSVLSVFSPAIMAAGVLLLLAVLALGIQFGSRRDSSREVQGWAARHRRLNQLMLVSIMWILSTLMSVTSFGAVIPSRVLQVIVWGSVALLIAVVAAFGIPLYRMSMESTGGTDGTPEECWRWGSIYYNAADPAMIVEKRDGPGYTLNFAHPFSWCILALIAIITAVPIILSVSLRP